MQQSTPLNLSVHMSKPLDQCPNLNFAISSTSAVFTDTNTHQSTVMYNIKDLNEICLPDKNYASCLDHTKSLYTFNALFSNNQIGDQKCGDLSILASTLKLCTPGMNQITQYYADNKNKFL